MAINVAVAVCDYLKAALININYGRQCYCLDAIGKRLEGAMGTVIRHTIKRDNGLTVISDCWRTSDFKFNHYIIKENKHE